MADSRQMRLDGGAKAWSGCLNDLQTMLVEDGALEKALPSYLVECLVHNVPSAAFGDPSYFKDSRTVLGHIWSATRDDGNRKNWGEVHDLKYLFRGSRDWDRHEAHRLPDKAWDAAGVA